MQVRTKIFKKNLIIITMEKIVTLIILKNSKNLLDTRYQKNKIRSLNIIYKINYYYEKKMYIFQMPKDTF